MPLSCGSTWEDVERMREILAERRAELDAQRAQAEPPTPAQRRLMRLQAEESASLSAPGGIREEARWRLKEKRII